MDRPNNPSETKYLLIGEEEFERLLRSYYILGKGLLAFEYLCGHSDRPMYLSAEGVCEVLVQLVARNDRSRRKFSSGR